MGMFDRLKRLIKGNVDSMMRKAEDPEKVLNQVILDMTKQLADAKRNVAAAIADEKLLQKRVDTQFTNAQEWERRAMVALRAGKEELARDALSRRNQEQQHAEQLRTQVERQHEAVEGLKETLRGLESKVEEARRRKTLLVARAKRAEAQKKIQELVTGLGDTSAFDAFEEMSERVEQLESQTEAMAEIEFERGGDASLEEQIAALERPDSDAQLDELRRKMAIEGTSSQDYRVDESGGSEGMSLDELKRKLNQSG